MALNCSFRTKLFLNTLQCNWNSPQPYTAPGKILVSPGYCEDCSKFWGNREVWWWVADNVMFSALPKVLDITHQGILLLEVVVQQGLETQDRQIILFFLFPSYWRLHVIGPILAWDVEPLNKEICVAPKPVPRVFEQRYSASCTFFPIYFTSNDHLQHLVIFVSCMPQNCMVCFCDSLVLQQKQINKQYF